MSYFYQVTLNQGRTDTLLVESDSELDVRSFFDTVSTANVTSIKKIVFSKVLGIGSMYTTYIPNNQNRYLNVLVQTEKGYTTTLNFQFPIKLLDKQKIIDSIKKNLLCNGDKITKVLNIMINE